MDLRHSLINFELLRNNKNKFLLACQPLIEIIVKKYISKGVFHHADFQDITQSINEVLFQKLELVEKQYNGSVQLTTYLSVIIRNICLSQTDKYSHNSKRDNIFHQRIITEPDVEYKLYINDEVNRLTTLLKLYNANKSKIIICTKVYFRIPINQFDITLHLKDFDKLLISRLIHHFGQDYADSYESNNFQILSAIFCKANDKSTSGDSLRKWTERKIHEIIFILNGTPPRYSYDVKTFRELFEYFCYRHFSTFN